MRYDKLVIKRKKVYSIHGEENGNKYEPNAEHVFWNDRRQPLSVLYNSSIGNLLMNVLQHCHNSWNDRPFDDLSQEKIRFEREAILFVISKETGVWDIFQSDILDDDNK